jgi:3-hydroxyisobutyrate dehydrogenase-like beta-hydroxyacid dehydrogenase
MIVASTILALGEAAVLADHRGLDLTVLFDLLAGDTPTAASSAPAGSGSSPRTTARPAPPSTW